MANTTQPFSFPQFNVPFPYASLPDQLAASFVPPNQQFTNASQYGRFNGVNNNAFGLFPSQFQSLFGSPTAPPMQFQPPYGNNGYLGSNQGPGSNPGNQPPPTQPPPSGGAPSGPMPGAQPGPGGTYPMPTNPQFVNPNRVPVGGVGPAPPFNLNPNAINSVGPSGMNAPVNKMAGGPTGLLSSPGIPGSNQAFSANMSHNPIVDAFIRANPNSDFAKAQMAIHSFTPAQFNTVAGQNPMAALNMLSSGGQNFRNAVMQSNGWTNDQMNQFINNTTYSGANRGFDPQTQQLLQSAGVR